MPPDNELDLADLLPSDLTAEQRAAQDREDEGDPTPTPAELATAEIERYKRENARYAGLADIVSELEADPSKIFNLRAALQGGQAPANTQQQVQPQLTQEQKQALDDAFRDRPAEMTALAGRTAAQEEMQRAYREMLAPVMEASGESVVENYKNKHRGDPLFSKVERAFDTEMSDVDRVALLRAPAKVRAREMDLRYRAATEKVLREAMVEGENRQHDTARNLGSGQGGNSKRSKLNNNPDLVRLALATGGLISQEDLQAILAEAGQE